MRAITWDNPNKMHIETGHVTFDRQCRYIGTGNQIGDTVFAAYIRPFNTPTLPNGQPCAPGEMQRWDLNEWWKGRNMPHDVRHFVETKAIDEAVILYQFFHHQGQARIEHGWIVTDEQHRLLHKFYSGTTAKSRHVLDVCLEYITA